MALVARQVVDDDDVARRERRHEDLSHVLQEALAIDGAVEELGGGHAAQPQPGNERGLLAVPVRDRRAQAHSSRRAAVQASHVGGGKALVDEHELRRIEIELGFEPVLTSLHHVGAVLLGGVQRLLFEGQAAAIEEGPDRAGAGPHAFLLDEPAPQFFDGGVRCGLDHRQQEVAMGVELGAGPASLPACRTLAAVAQTLNPLDRCRNADVEANRGLARRRPVSRGLNHSVPQILTVRSRHACFASAHTDSGRRTRLGFLCGREAGRLVRHESRRQAMARVAGHLSVEDLEAGFRSARDPTATRHFQVIWLLARGHTIADVAAVTSFGRRWIEQLLARYNAHGPAALGDLRRRNGGVPSVLRPGLLERLRARLTQPPPDGGLWTSPKVAAWMAGERGLAAVLPQRGWEALKAIDWSVQKPRPRHPAGATPEEQEAFKKARAGRRRGAGPAPGQADRGLGHGRAPHRAEADLAPGLGAQRPEADRAWPSPL